MIIVLVMMLSTISSISSYKPPRLEQVMRKTLEQVMRCPDWTIDEDLQQPIAAFSPARYMQLVALVRKDSGENSCGIRNHLPFNLNKPNTWDFCAMGICSEESCSCFKNFVGERCNVFQGQCWLFYCRLIGCNQETPTLYCSCNPSLYGTDTAREIYFYDQGLRSSYIPPPPGYITDAFVDSHLIKKTALGEYEIIGGNYYHDSKEIRAYNRKYEEQKYFTYPKFNHKIPAQNYEEGHFNNRFRRKNNPYLRYNERTIFRKPLTEDFQSREIVPSNVKRSYFQNNPNSAPNAFYGPKSKRGEKRYANLNDFETFLPYQDDDKAFHYNYQSDKHYPNLVSRRMNQKHITDFKPKMNQMNYLGNIDDGYSEYKSDKFQPNWSQNKRALYPKQKFMKNYELNKDDWMQENYLPGNELSNKIDYNRRFYNLEDYRMKRQKPILDQNTIREAWADDEETDDNEDFKFTSGSRTYRYLIYYVFLSYSATVIANYYFL